MKKIVCSQIVVWMGEEIHKIGNSAFNNARVRWASHQQGAGPCCITILLRLALSELDKDFISYEGMNNLTI